MHIGKTVIYCLLSISISTVFQMLIHWQQRTQTCFQHSPVCNWSVKQRVPASSSCHWSVKRIVPGHWLSRCCSVRVLKQFHFLSVLWMAKLIHFTMLISTFQFALICKSLYLNCIGLYQDISGSSLAIDIWKPTTIQFVFIARVLGLKFSC